MLVQQALRDKLDELKLTQVEAARRMRMSRGNLSDILTGKKSITEKVALKLEGVTGLKAENIMQLQTRETLEKMREEAKNGTS